MHIDFRCITDPDVDSGVSGGRELVALGHVSTLAAPDPSAVTRLAAKVGPVAAVTAVEIAGVFAMINRIMDATGSPVHARKLEIAHPVLKQIGAMDFPNADVSVVRKNKTGRRLRKVLYRLRR